MTGWWTTPECLDALRDGGVLEPADVHLAAALVRLAGLRPDDPDHDANALAVALAARAPRDGHVGVDLARIAADLAVSAVPADHADVADSAVSADHAVPADHADVADPTRDHRPAWDAAVAATDWPEPETWLDRVAAGPLVRPTDGSVAPLTVHRGLLYLDRYRTAEAVVARHVVARAASLDETSAPLGVATGLLTGEGADRQLAAVDSALRRRLSVLVGGPGTGKTTTVAAIVAELAERAGTAGGVGVHVALAAPTGKAAARLGEAFRDAAARLPGHLAVALGATTATTIHRLLGTVPGSRSRFRHDRRDPLPHDVVIVDESSMISLPLMAQLLDALRPEARLVIVGDPDQLASVEAGAVLGDIAGAARPGSPLAACVTALEHSRRFPAGSPIGRFAAAVRSGDADAALAVLTEPATLDVGDGALRWVAGAADAPNVDDLVRDRVLPGALAARDAAEVGDAAAALGALGEVRVLCAHRTGPSGVDWWNRRVETWLGAPSERWYPGRPVLVTANDHRTRLYNGDLGVVVALHGRLSVAFANVAVDAVEGIRTIGPSRLDAVETTHAMTIHKSQGSEFDHVVVLLPSAGSRLATRELLYTAVTRARREVTVVGDAAAVRAAIGRRTERASRLRDDLVDPTGVPTA